MDIDKIRYEMITEEIKKISDELIIAQNEDNYEMAIKAYKKLSSLYSDINYYDFEGKTYYFLANYMYTKEKLENIELYLDKAYETYIKSFNKENNYTLHQNNNEFFNNVAALYLKINKAKKAYDVLMRSIRTYSVSFNLNRTVSLIFEAETQMNKDINNYLYKKFGTDTIMEIRGSAKQALKDTYVDPIEFSNEFENILNEVEDKIILLANEKGISPNTDEYFKLKSDYILENYGIEWLPPKKVVD
ncbi:MAG: hypothetical protein K6G38_00060 [Gammaproteobacteria bacterium]|nr:hypothetical protein [Gammaproteobacteria bacterium]